MKRLERPTGTIDAVIVEVDDQPIQITASPSPESSVPVRTLKVEEALSRVPAVRELPRWEDGEA